MCMQGESQKSIHSYRLMVDALTTRKHGQELSAHIKKILQSIGEFIDVSRAYVFEDDLDGKVTCNTYEWCAEGVTPQIDELQAVPMEQVAEWHVMLESDGIIKASDISELPDSVYDILHEQGIFSIVVLPLELGDEIFGFIGFDECRRQRDWTDDEIETLRAMSGLVSTFVVLSNAEKRSKKSNRMLRAVLDNIETPIYVTDPATHRILFANKKYTEELSQPTAEGSICHKTTRKLDEPCPDCPVNALLKQDMGYVHNREVYNDHSDKWYYCTDSLIEWIDGRTVHLQTALDITGRKGHEEQLVYNAAHDVMTGIRNRVSGLAMLNELVAQGKKQGFVLTICFLDLDDLKYVNDTFGHVEGDRLITTFVETVKRCIRTSDVFARIGGDEFIIALRSCAMANARRIIKNIHAEVDKLNSSNELPFKMSFSEGLEEVLPESEDNVDTIIMNADRKMYNKKQSKNVKRHS